MAYIEGSDDPTVKDKIVGTYDADDIYLFRGNDVANGGFGDDYIYGGDGNDTMQGGYGDDVIHGDAGADQLSGGTGDDQLTGGAGKDLMAGGDGDDVLSVGNVSDMVGDTVDGGSGTDALVASYDSSRTKLVFAALNPLDVYTAQGGYTVTGVERYFIAGTQYGDNIAGYDHDDSFLGGAGSDTLAGHGGRDTLNGQSGSDTILGGHGADVLYGDDYSGGAADHIEGGAGADTVHAYDGNDVVTGDNGWDVLNGDAGNDTMSGGVGNDDLYGGDGADSLSGGAGNDFMVSNFFNFELPGTDTGTEKDVLNGDDGNDYCGIGVGDRADGGADVDVVGMAFDASNVGVAYTVTTATVTLANGTVVSGFECIDFSGGAGADTITGGLYDDTMRGGGGADKLTGLDGDDHLQGNDGNDTMVGGAGQDIFTDNGSGNDSMSGGDDADSFSVGLGNDTVSGDGGNDYIYLTDDAGGADLIDGGANFDTVDFVNAGISVVIDLQKQSLNDGATKNDSFKGVEQFIGGYHDDVMLGDSKDNLFKGNIGDDTLNGRDGNDTLDGGSGPDLLTGGNGADTFVIRNGDDFGGTTWPSDRITDFTHGQDTLQISLADFQLDNQADFFLVNGTDPQPTTTDGVFLFHTDTHELWYDQDGVGDDKDPYLIATLNGVNTLSASDFSLIV